MGEETVRALFTEFEELNEKSIRLFWVFLVIYYCLMHVLWSGYHHFMYDEIFIKNIEINPWIIHLSKNSYYVMLITGVFFWIYPKILFPIYLLCFWAYVWPFTNILNFHDQHNVFLIFCFCFFGLKLWSKFFKDDVLPIRQLTMILLAMFYYAAGIGKYIYGGAEWHDGHSIQFRLIEFYANADGVIGLWIAKSFLLCQILSYVTLIFEIGFPLCLFYRKLQKIAVIGTAFFIFSVFVVMRIDFISFVIPGYFVFLPWNRILPYFEAKIGPHIPKSLKTFVSDGY